jgi:hypothetical protein
MIGIVEFHPLDGTERGLFLLAHGPSGEFRVPVTQDQAVALLSRIQEAPAPAEEEEEEEEEFGGYEEFEQALHGEPSSSPAPDGFRMGAAELDDDDDDGDL